MRTSTSFRTGPTGPRTEEGKNRSRLNAFKHGLTGRISLLGPAEQAAFEQYRAALVDALAPVGLIEQEYADAIADGRWRLHRASAIENGIFALGGGAAESDVDVALNHAQTWLEKGKNIQLLSLYQQRIERSVERNTTALRLLQAERAAARKQAIEEAVLLSDLAQSKGEDYDPADDLQPGEFAFSPTEIRLAVAREMQLAEARNLPKCVSARPTRVARQAAA